MIKYEIRPLRESDIESVIAIDAVVTGTGGPDRAGFWRGLLSIHVDPSPCEVAPPSPQLCEVAQIAGGDEASPGQVVGFIIGDVQSWQFGIPRHGRIVTIGVDPAHARKGVATLLAGALVGTFRKMGLPFIHCLARPGDALGDFFRSVGFEKSGFEVLEKRL